MTQKIKPLRFIGIALSVSCLAFSSTSHIHHSPRIEKQMETKTATPQENKQVIRTLYEKILNQRHLEELSTVIDDSYTGVRGQKGAEGFKATVTGLITAFPDIQWHIEDLIAEDDKVTVRWKWTGTFQHPFRGIAPTQKTITNEAMVVYQLRKGKAIAAWIQSDQLGFLIEAGVISPSVIPGGTGQPTPAKH